MEVRDVVEVRGSRTVIIIPCSRLFFAPSINPSPFIKTVIEPSEPRSSQSGLPVTRAGSRLLDGPELEGVEFGLGWGCEFGVEIEVDVVVDFVVGNEDEESLKAKRGVNPFHSDQVFVSRMAVRTVAGEALGMNVFARMVKVPVGP